MDKKNYTTPVVRSIALHTHIAAGSIHVNNDGEADPNTPMMSKKGFLDILDDYYNEKEGE